MFNSLTLLASPETERDRATAPSDDALMTRFVAGDIEAFEILVDRHESALIGFCVYMLGHSRRDSAQDVAQEVLLRIVERASSYEGRGQFVPWMMTIARHRCLDTLRGKTLHQDHRAEVSSDEDPSMPLRVRQLRDRLDEAVQSELSPRQRETFALHRMGLAYAEVAQALGISRGAVKYHIFEARERLRATLAEFLED